MYLIGSYQKDAVYNKKNIHRIYRIAPEKLGVVPYNPEFEMACREEIRQVYPWQETVTSDRYEGKFFHRVRAYRTDDFGAV